MLLKSINGHTFSPCVETFRAVIKSVARSLQSVSVCLEHHGGTVLSDSSSHHCWFFPPEDTSLQPAAGEGGPTRSDGRWSDTGSVKDKRESVRGGCVGPKDRIPHQAASLTRPVSSSEGSGLCSTVYNERWRSLKTCGCGCVRLLDLPPTCKWIPLRDDRLSMYVPDSIKQCLKRPSTEDSSSGQTCGSSKEKLPFPCVCDAFLPKLRAIETAGDLSSTVLRIAFSISEK